MDKGEKRRRQRLATAKIHKHDAPALALEARATQYSINTADDGPRLRHFLA